MSASDKPTEITPLVRVSIDGPIANIVFDRPGAMNIITMDLVTAFGSAISRVRQASEVRALVLSGSGRAFMAGGDLHYLHESTPEVGAGLAGTLIAALHSSIQALADLPIPVLASIHGAAAGAGLSVMLGCDFVIAAADTSFVFAYSQIGAPPDGGLTWSLPRAIGLRAAMEFAFIRQRMTAPEALASGLITRIVPPAELEQATLTFAKQLASLPTRAFASTKQLMGSSPSVSLEQQLSREKTAFQEAVPTQDFQEGVNAFFERREPSFQGL